MAGDWIKFEKATLDKPEVLAMAEALSIRSDEVVGKLLRVWSWFDGASANGNVESVTDVTLRAHINKLTDIAGFADAMEKVKWLSGTTMPNFERHNGKSAKKRAVTAERVGRFRVETRNAIDVTREEKRREEEKITALSGTKPDDRPDSQKARRQEAIKIGERCIAYLNERAGTAYQITDVNVALPRARILGEGATEEQLRAVVDAKVAEWGADPEMRKFLRPGTLFNREKFAQYVGQLSSKLPAPEKKKRIEVLVKHDDNRQKFLFDLYLPAIAKVEFASIAKGAFDRFAGSLARTARYLVVKVEGEDTATFSIEELK